VDPDWRWCPACGGQLDSSWQFCQHCGVWLSDLLPYGTYRKPRPADHRTRAGLAWTMWAHLFLGFPTIALFGGLLYSVGSWLLYRDRRRFGPGHDRSVRLAFVLLWIAFFLYAGSFGALLYIGNEAFLDGRRLPELTGLMLNYTVATTVPTVLVVCASGLQIQHLAPKGSRAIWYALALLLALIAAATALSYVDIAPGLPDARIGIATVSGVLNRISLWRSLEAPGFLLFAYLYRRALKDRKASPAVESAVPS